MSINDSRLGLEQSKTTTRGSNENMGFLGLEGMDIDRFFNTTVNSLNLEVSEFSETLEFVLNLEGQFSSVAQD